MRTQCRVSSCAKGDADGVSVPAWDGARFVASVSFKVLASPLQCILQRARRMPCSGGLLFFVANTTKALHLVGWPKVSVLAWLAVVTPHLSPGIDDSRQSYRLVPFGADINLRDPRPAPAPLAAIRAKGMPAKATRALQGRFGATGRTACDGI